MDERIIQALEDIINLAEKKNTDRATLINELRWLLEQVKNM